MEAHGIRLSTSLWPTNQQDCNQMKLPLGCVYTPLKNPEMVLSYPPVECPNCRSILNPYAKIDFQRFTWVCPLCNRFNPLPSNYHGMSESTPAAEITPDFSTIEYTLREGVNERPIYVFVVDLCSIEKEHNYLRDILLKTIALLPQNSLIGLITFGTNCNIKELIYSECPRDFVFNGKKTYTSQQLQQFLSYYPKPGDNNSNNIIIPIDQAEQMLLSLLDNLEHDPFATPKGERPNRCTGAALHLAVNLIKAIYPSHGGNVILFTSGPITRGPGAIASLKRTDTIRQHRDIELGNAPLCEPAKEFFTTLGQEASAENIVINVISASFEESGVHEMFGAVMNTGGFIRSCETWNDDTIPQSLEKFLSQEFVAGSGLNAEVSVTMSPGIALKNCIGPCIQTNSAAAPNPATAAPNAAVQTTQQFHCAGVCPTTTLAFYFETSAQKASPMNINGAGFIQLSIKYKSLVDGTQKQRVSTFYINFGDLASQSMDIMNKMDVQTTATLIAKTCVTRALKEPLPDTVKFLDKMLIDMCRALGNFTRGKADTLSLHSNLGDLSRFLYHFRRSSFMQTFNFGPDETSAVRWSMIVESAENCALMMMPLLKAFPVTSMSSYQVPLEMNSLKSDTVLFLDTYFRALVWYGHDVAAWKHQGIHEMKDYENVRHAIEAPQAEAGEVVKRRFPVPQLITCEQDSSLARYLVARCNPAQLDGYNTLGAGDNLGSDEISYDKFFAKLKVAIVK